MKRPVYELSVFLLWILFLGPLCFSYPLEGGTDVPRLRVVEELDRLKLGFGWRNLSCALCKAIFASVDIALLVRSAAVFTSMMVFVYFKSSWRIFYCLFVCLFVWESKNGFLVCILKIESEVHRLQFTNIKQTLPI